jgi:serine/threonine-protein kinase
MNTAPPPLPAVIGGKYRPLRLIARGGMGAVYEVVHANTGEHLALKLMLARSLLKPDLVERFRQEARIQSSIKSEHVVRVVDADVAPEIDGAPFLVMELLAGKDFERICEERRPTPEEAVDWLRQAGSALDKAHKERIVHRDLKPENIFLAEREDLPPIVKVLDFGVAKLIGESDDGSTKTGQILGTPRYMSPEQAAGGKKISPAADRFVLGLIAFRLLAGRHYFEGDNWVTLLQTVTRGPTTSPSNLGCPYGTAFDLWFARACALEPTERFGTCAEQVDALASSLAGASFRWRRKLWPPRPAFALGTIAGACGVAALVWSVGRERAPAPRAAITDATAAAPATTTTTTTTRATKTTPVAPARPEAADSPSPVPSGGPPLATATHERSARRHHAAAAKPAVAKAAATTAKPASASKPVKDSVWDEP